jgi:hypothetical protein
MQADFGNGMHERSELKESEVRFIERHGEAE